MPENLLNGDVGGYGGMGGIGYGAEARSASAGVLSGSSLRRISHGIRPPPSPPSMESLGMDFMGAWCLPFHRLCP